MILGSVTYDEFKYFGDRRWFFYCPEIFRTRKRPSFIGLTNYATVDIKTDK